MAIPVRVADPGYLECTYNVPADAGTVNIMRSTFIFLPAITAMEVDGVSVPVATSYEFATSGEHVVRFYVSQIFEMPNMFSGITALTKVAFHINPLVQVQLKATFGRCSALTSIDFGSSYVYCNTLEDMFNRCGNGLTVDVSRIELRQKGASFSARNAFAYASIKEIVFGDVDALYLYNTFWNLQRGTTLIDFTRVKAITYQADVFINADQPDVMDFGYCDMSGLALTANPFIEYHTTKAGRTIMLGKPYTFTRWKSQIGGFKGTLIYNLEYDYSDIIWCNGLTAQAYAPVEKTLRVRFCTNNAWVTDPSAEFVINGVRGAYVSQGIWVFGMTAETYKYPVFYNGTEIGEAIVKDDVQNIAFGTNNAVYKVIDFSAADSFDPAVIVENDGWEWHKRVGSTAYFGLISRDIPVGEMTSVTINTGMSGDIHLTLAQESQTYYHYGRIYNSAGVELKHMYGSICQSSKDRKSVV